MPVYQRLAHWKLRSFTGVCTVLLVIPLLVGGCSGAAASQPKTSSNSLGLVHPGYLTVGTLTNNPPMEEEYPPSSGRYRGVDIELAQALARAMGLKGTIFVPDSWTTLIPHLLRSRKFDVIMADMNDTPARRQMIDFVDYMRADEGILVWKNSSIYADGYEWLCGETVAVDGTDTVEYSQLEAAGARCSHPRQVRCPGVRQTRQTAICIHYAGNTFAQFLRHPSWAYTTDLPITDYDLRRYSQKLRYAGQPIQTGQNYGIGVSTFNPSLEDALFDAVSKIMSSGEYQAILKRWGVGTAGY
jgi:polar amino acid transport system substrate-binding protein